MASGPAAFQALPAPAPAPLAISSHPAFASHPPDESHHPLRRRRRRALAGCNPLLLRSTRIAGPDVLPFQVRRWRTQGSAGLGSSRACLLWGWLWGWHCRRPARPCTLCWCCRLPAPPCPCAGAAGGAHPPARAQASHANRALALGPRNGKLYTGIRNAAGFEFHPQTGNLLFAVMEQDRMGDNRVRCGGVGCGCWRCCLPLLLLLRSLYEVALPKRLHAAADLPHTTPPAA